MAERFERAYHLTEAYGHACDFLAGACGLSKSKIKDAMNKGAVGLTRGGKQQRLRRASAPLQVDDEIALHYDSAILAQVPPPVRLLADNGKYSVWHKPAGMLAQGTLYGDHCALLRLAEQHTNSSRYLVHRLDREAEGLMLLAHSPASAAQLSQQFQQRTMEKIYHAEVLGDPGSSGSITLALDGKSAHTEFVRLAWRAEDNVALLQVRIDTGRRHQIRRHLAAIGHPLMGDPRYGIGNKNQTGMRLAATGLAFICPYRKQRAQFNLAEWVDSPWWLA